MSSVLSLYFWSSSSCGCFFCEMMVDPLHHRSRASMTFSTWNLRLGSSHLASWCWSGMNYLLSFLKSWKRQGKEDIGTWPKTYKIIKYLRIKWQAITHQPAVVVVDSRLPRVNFCQPVHSQVLFVTFWVIRILWLQDHRIGSLKVITSGHQNSMWLTRQSLVTELNSESLSLLVFTPFQTSPGTTIHSHSRATSVSRRSTRYTLSKL